jgi:sugar lactone lactonase YvrE
MNSAAAVNVFRNTEAILGESLLWDASAPDPAMLWCDITAGLIHRSPLSGSVDGSDDTILALPAPVASFGFADIGGESGLVVSLEATVILVGADGRVLRVLAEIEHAGPGMRLNEGKVDPFGGWVTGSMTLATSNPDAQFYRVDSAGAVTVLQSGLGVANGLEWSPQGDRIYFTDTSVNTIYSAPYGERVAELADVTPFAQGAPHDGLVADTGGGFWGAIYGEGRVSRMDAAGREIASVELPVPNVTSVAFGGRNLSTLYVTSARENMTEEQLEEHPLSGAVFSIETDTSGRPSPVFRA